MAAALFEIHAHVGWWGSAAHAELLPRVSRRFRSGDGKTGGEWGTQGFARAATWMGTSGSTEGGAGRC